MREDFQYLEMMKKMMKGLVYLEKMKLKKRKMKLKLKKKTSKKQKIIIQLKEKQ